MTVKEFEQHHGVDSNIDGGNFSVPVCLLSASTAPHEARGCAAVPIVIPQHSMAPSQVFSSNRRISSA